jgi:glycosyltransferase involved in cell wall biosynthesis
MKTILVLAYAISPTLGSEYSVAWNYVQNMSKDNKLIVLYGVCGKNLGDVFDVEDYAKKHPNPNIRYVPIQPDKITDLLNALNKRGVFVYSFYFAYRHWHKLAYKKTLQIVREEKVNLIHYLNPIGYREPGFLWKIDKPYIWGPIGGFENYALHLSRNMPFSMLMRFRFRTLANDLQKKLNLRVKQAILLTDVLLTATESQKSIVKALYGKDSVYLPEGAVTGDLLRPVNEKKFENLKMIELLAIGSLDARKNFSMILDALKKTKRKESLHLNILGDGPERLMLMQKTMDFGLEGIVSFVGKIKRSEALNVISKSHLNIITSLGEENTTIILETMAQGVPTLTLDHCGMHDTVTEETGFKIPVDNYENAVGAIAQDLDYCVEHPEILREKAFTTYERSKQYLWSKRASFWNEIYDKAISAYNDKRNTNHEHN